VVEILQLLHSVLFSFISQKEKKKSRWKSKRENGHDYAKISHRHRDSKEVNEQNFTTMG
jgi:hypothetical protein